MTIKKTLLYVLSSFLMLSFVGLNYTIFSYQAYVDTEFDWLGGKVGVAIFSGTIYIVGLTLFYWLKMKGSKNKHGN